MVACDLRIGTRVSITGAAAGAIGRIEQIWPIDMVEFVPGVDASGDAMRREWKAWGVARVALISFHVTRYCEAMFAAYEVAGAWFDLRGNPIALEVIGHAGN
jgi:hypothetical protein